MTITSIAFINPLTKNPITDPINFNTVPMPFPILTINQETPSIALPKSRSALNAPSELFSVLPKIDETELKISLIPVKIGSIAFQIPPPIPFTTSQIATNIDFIISYTPLTTSYTRPNTKENTFILFKRSVKGLIHVSMLKNIPNKPPVTPFKAPIRNPADSAEYFSPSLKSF